ncbi:fungal-specific transcription factor domain-containing protein [Mucor mucedo]|uniref:fungal-specific transcription factor domain-containing protein n=1 Tax=Mucor mucedo TaxID=29922 RepID=UPI00221FE366|nr:fungal-specific transcription factor domain-containing protein [Mucor mucedo]KAI7888757.1 fungal-specific transcription factor domain-containing protein [Mucor mucedo]
MDTQRQATLETFPPIENRKRSKKDRACDLCRRKKIRCDYDSAYPHIPCASCKSYNKECTFKEAAKKRGPPKGYVEGLESRLKRMEKLLMNIASNGNVAPTIAADSDSEAHNEEEEEEDTGVEDDQGAEYQRNGPSAVEAPENEKDGPFSYVGSSSGIYLLSRLFPKDGNGYEESDPIPRPVDGHEEDLMIANYNSRSSWNNPTFMQHAAPDWKLPPKALTDYLTDMYFRRINNLLPILDEEQFYENYEKGDYNPRFTAIVMAVCRATCRLLKKDDEIVMQYGIDRGSFFRDLTNQLDVNFDLDFLEPKMETIQVLLLNASNPTKWGLESTDWIITSIAVKMAQDLGLHRANTQHEPKKVTEAKKRLWWSAYVIDRVVCASLGRPLTISDADCDVESPDAQDTKYSQFTHLVKLSCILGDILRALCSPRARMMSEKGHGLENISRSLEKMLIEWKSCLPPQLSLSDAELDKVSRKEIDPVLQEKLNDGAGKLRFIYCAVYLLSKRPFISMGSGYTSNVKMPVKCQETLRIAVDLFETMEITSLLCSWSLSNTNAFVFKLSEYGS